MFNKTQELFWIHYACFLRILCSLIRDLLTIKFDYLQYAKTKGEGLLHILFDVNDIIYLGRQRSGGVANLKNKLEASPCSICPSGHEVENLPLIVRDKEHVRKMHSFD